MSENINEKNIEINQEEVENEEMVDTSSDERFIELEIQKELMRMDREIVYDDESLAEMINEKDFQKGCKEASLFCGFYTSLINAGLSNQQAYEMTINKQTCDHNRKLQEIINKNQLEVSKVQQIQIQGNQL